MVYKVFFDQFFKFCQKNYVLRRNDWKITLKHDFLNGQWQNSYFHRTLILWNKLPEEVVLFEKVENFRLKLKKFK